MFLNYLSNAMKFMDKPKGKIMVIVSLIDPELEQEREYLDYIH